MDTNARRTLYRARDLLADEFLHRSVPSVNTGQRLAIEDLVNELTELLQYDPQPPECQNCATALDQADTGRPRRFCTTACRQAHFRAGQARFRASQTTE